MAQTYRKFLRLLEKWPVDPTKKSRDLGQYLREQVKINFSRPDHLPPNTTEEECSKIYETLHRLTENKYKIKYERISNSSATGLTAEQCKAVLSDDFLQYLKEDNAGFMSRLLNRKES